MYSTKSINIGAGYSCQSHFISFHLIEKTKKSFECVINFIFANLVLLNARWHTTRSTSIDKDDDQKLCGVCIERNQPLEIKREKSKFSTRIKKNENIDRAHDNDNGYEDDAAKCTQMLLPFERRISLASDCVCVAVFGN